MSIAEKLFRIFSLIALVVGFLLGMMSADKEVKVDQALFKTEGILNDIRVKETVEQINAGHYDNPSMPGEETFLTDGNN